MDRALMISGMAGSCNFNLSTIARRDLMSRSEEREKVTGIPYVMRTCRREAEVQFMTRMNLDFGLRQRDNPEKNQAITATGGLAVGSFDLVVPTVTRKSLRSAQQAP